MNESALPWPPPAWPPPAHPPPARPPIAQLPAEDHESALLVSTLPLVGVAVALLFGAGCLMLWCKERAHTIPASGIMQSNDEYRREQQRRRERQLRRYRAQRYPDGVGDRRSSRRSQGGESRRSSMGGQLARRPSTEQAEAATASSTRPARRSSRERRLRVEPSGGAPPPDAELEPASDLELTAVSAARRAIKADGTAERDDAPERPKGAALQRARAHQERVRQRLAIERQERRAAELEAAREPGHAPAAAAEEEEGAAARLPDVDLELTSDEEDESSTHSSGGRSGGHSSSGGGEASGSAEAEAAAADARALVTGCANGVRGLSLDDRLAAAPPVGWAEMGRREYMHTSES